MGRKALKPVVFTTTVVVLLVGMVLLFMYYFIHSTVDDVNRQNRQFLTEISQQNAFLIRDTVNMELDKLAAIANIIGLQVDFSEEDAMQILKAEAARSGFKRLGFVPSNGIAVTSDGLTMVGASLGISESGTREASDGSVSGKETGNGSALFSSETSDWAKTGKLAENARMSVSNRVNIFFHGGLLIHYCFGDNCRRYDRF